MRYVIRFMACVGLAYDPLPDRTIGGGNAKRLTTYIYLYTHTLRLEKVQQTLAGRPASWQRLFCQLFAM